MASEPSNLRHLFGDAPQQSIDVSSVIRRSRARRAPRVLGASAVAVVTLGTVLYGGFAGLAGLGAAGSVAELATTSALKLVVQPLVAYAVARFALGVDGHALLAIVVTSALPTAQNIFVHATRYDRATVLARDTILITTMGSVPVILVVAALLG